MAKKQKFKEVIYLGNILIVLLIVGLLLYFVFSPKEKELELKIINNSENTNVPNFDIQDMTTWRNEPAADSLKLIKLSDG